MDADDVRLPTEVESHVVGIERNLGRACLFLRRSIKRAMLMERADEAANCANATRARELRAQAEALRGEDDGR